MLLSSLICCSITEDSGYDGACFIPALFLAECGGWTIVGMGMPDWKEKLPGSGATWRRFVENFLTKFWHKLLLCGDFCRHFDSFGLHKYLGYPSFVFVAVFLEFHMLATYHRSHPSTPCTSYVGISIFLGP